MFHPGFAQMPSLSGCDPPPHGTQQTREILAVGVVREAVGRTWQREQVRRGFPSAAPAAAAEPAPGFTSDAPACGITSAVSPREPPAPIFKESQRLMHRAAVGWPWLKRVNDRTRTGGRRAGAAGESSHLSLGL